MKKLIAPVIVGLLVAATTYAATLSQQFNDYFYRLPPQTSTLTTDSIMLLRGGAVIRAPISTIGGGGGGGGITALTGDGTATGTGSVSLTLANTGIAAATYGDATHVPQCSFDSKGRATICTNVLISGGGGGGAPGGSSGAFQYNASGGFGGAVISGLVLGNGAGPPTAYGGTSCTNQFPRSVNASGIATCNNVSLTSDIGGFGTSVAAALSINVGSAGSVVLNGGALGTPSSAVLTNATGLNLTSGVTSTLPVANGGTGITAGTSGGVPFYSAAATINSSGTLGAGLPMVGGGAGAAPSTGTKSGNTTQFVTTTGSQTSGRCVEIDASGNHIQSAAPCGTGGGSGANPSATIGAAAVNGVATTFLRSDGAPAIGTNAVTNPLLAQMANARVKGRITAGTGNPEDMTGAQVASILPEVDITTIANAGVTGTTLSKLAKLTSGTAVITATTDVDGILGVVTAGAGTTGTPTVAFGGTASCVFDGATTTGNFVVNSATVAGDCHDAGSSRPTGTQVVGRVLSTNGSGGTYMVALQLNYANAAGGGSLNTTDGTNSVASTTQQTFGKGFKVGGSAGSATVDLTVADPAAKTGNYTVLAADMSNALNLAGAGFVLTLPAVSATIFQPGMSVSILVSGTGNWTVTNSTGLTLSNFPTTLCPGTQGTLVANGDGTHLDFFGTVCPAALNTSQSWTAAQAVTPVALTDAATIAVDASLSNSFTVTLGGNRALGNPTNLKAGQFVEFQVTQDGTGSRTLTYGGNYKFAGGTAPTLTTAIGAIDVISCWASTTSRLNCQALLDVK